MKPNVAPELILEIDWATAISLGNLLRENFPNPTGECAKVIEGLEGCRGKNFSAMYRVKITGPGALSIFIRGLGHGQDQQ